MYLNEQDQKIWFEVRNKHLSKLVLEVWDALPVDVREMATKYVTKVTDLPPMQQVERGIKARTIMPPWGSEIYLLPNRYRRTGDERIKYFIAHEVAHAIYHNPHLVNVLEDDVEEMEEWADECAEKWGFPDPNRGEGFEKIMKAYEEGRLGKLIERQDKQMKKANEQYFRPLKMTTD